MYPAELRGDGFPERSASGIRACYHDEAISSPTFPALTSDDQRAVVDALKSALQA
jgi:hypothetical protein